MTVNPIDAFLSTISTSKNILITAHERPDLDAVGSCLALATHLSQTKNAVVWLGDFESEIAPFPNLFPIQTQPPSPNTFDLVIVCDCSDTSRIFDWETHKKACLSKHPTVVNIDHHPDNTLFGDINIHDSISSVCEMMWQLFTTAKWPISTDIATYLYAGILFDTDRFLHSNTTAATLEIAAQLKTAGAHTALCHSILYETLTPDTIELIKTALNNLEIHHDIKTALTTIPLSFSGLPYKTIDLIRQIQGTDISIVISETDRYIKVNLRSKSDVSVSTFAHQFGGGGHHKAAGIEFKGPSLIEVKQTLLTALKATL